MKLNRSSKRHHHRQLGLAVIAALVCNLQKLNAAFTTTTTTSLGVSRQQCQSTTHCSVLRRMAPIGPAGSFFNPIPSDNNADDKKQDDIYIPMPTLDIGKQLQQPFGQPLPKTPTADKSANGFKKTTSSSSSSPPRTSSSKKNSYIAIDAATTSRASQQQQQPRKPSLNNINQPLRDEQGYTLYADEVTGEKSRVFQALVSYPCEFTLKIVGLADNGLFVQDMVAAVAARCDVPPQQLTHSTRAMGKWASLTIQAPVQNADMLYTLYDMLDQDPRVKFKF